MNRTSQSNGIARWVVPLVIVLFCVGAIYMTMSFAKMPPILKRGIQPGDFPRLVCILIIAMTILMIWRDPVRQLERITNTTWVTIVAMIGFVALVQIDLFLALSVFAVALAMLWGERRAHLLAMLGLLIPFSVFLMFDLVFKIRFPHGLLTSIWYG